MNKNYAGSIALTKMTNVIREMKGKDGKTTKVIILPIDANYLTLKDDKVYLNLSVLVREEPDKYGQNGFIAQRVDGETYKNADEKQKESFKDLPILGNIKDFSSGSSNDNVGTIKEPIGTKETDDLPF